MFKSNLLTKKRRKIDNSARFLWFKVYLWVTVQKLFCAAWMSEPDFSAAPSGSMTFSFHENRFRQIRPNLQVPSEWAAVGAGPAPHYSSPLLLTPERVFYVSLPHTQGCLKVQMEVSLSLTTSGCPSLCVLTKMSFLFKKNPLQRERDGFSRLLFWSRPLGRRSLNDSV